MGKYDSVIVDLKPLPPTDTDYQAKVDRVKQEVTDRTAPSLATSYAMLRGEKESVERLLYAINLRIAAHEQLLADSCEAKAEGWGAYGATPRTVKLPDGSSVRVDREPQGKINDKEALRLWCIANGYERQMQLWPSTVQSIVKERLLAGEAEPDGVEVYSYTKVVFTKGK